MRRTRCTLPLVLLTFLSDLPFAVHGLDHFGLFLFLLVLIFSGVAHASAPVQFASVFFCFAAEDEGEMR
jgi:hypothetical protein